ncbi:MAG: hypothetical protein JOZ52_15105 [Acidobacteria bacterium]|nr:hypothetical protein [Acidobacteriota bacterium]
MRWKLLLIASLIAGLIGSGATLAIIIFLLGSKLSFSSRAAGVIAFAPLVLPLAMLIVASLFVYRHTARRRKLQAMLTALLSALLMLTIFVLSEMLLTRKTQEPTTPPPAPQPSKIASKKSSIRDAQTRPQPLLT